MPDNAKRWYNWISDNGIPLPLVRHKGRGDLVATAVVCLLAVLIFVMAFGGSVFVLGGSVLTVPKLDSLAGAAAALVPFLAALFGYIRKRGQDKGDPAAPDSTTITEPPRV